MSTFKDTTVIRKLESMYPNLPLDFLNREKQHGFGVNKTCAMLPWPYDIRINNEFWQQVRRFRLIYFCSFLIIRTVNSRVVE